ncbi:hypothetical protein ACF0H5_017022 [Mactra antiquata]
MASLRKVLRNAMPNRRYNSMSGKENRGYAETPNSKMTKEKPSTTNSNQMDTEDRVYLRRNSSLTQSVRDVVGNFRQKLKKSTRQRKRLGQSSPATPASRYKKNGKGKRTPTRRGGYREVKMYSPFNIEMTNGTPRQRTPLGIRTRPMWHDVETPTRLRKEVEDLTANMQALVNLTPGKLQTRSSSRRSLQITSPLTNGSLKTPRSSRKVVITSVRRNVQATEI